MLLHVADKERGTTVNAKREKTSVGEPKMPEKPFVWGQPPFDSCAPTIYS